MRHALNVLGAGAIAISALTFSSFAAAQVAPPPPTLLITVDENGNGTVVENGTTTFPLVATQTPNNPLIYSSPFAAEVGGDVDLTDFLTGTVSDVIRFFPGDSQFEYFSDNQDGAEDLADVGIPTRGSTVVVFTEVGSEGDNGLFYTPSATQPGFMSNFATTYHFISDAPALPEPSTWVMMLVGFGAIGLRFRGISKRSFLTA